MFLPIIENEKVCVKGKRRNEMKKALSVVLAAVTAVSLCACGGAATASTATTSTAATSTASKADSAASSTAASAATTGDGSDELTVWCWDPAFNIYAMQEAEKVYQKTDPNFKLNIVETPWADLQTALTTAGTSGDYSTLPDIFLCQDNAFQKNVKNYPDMFTDLTKSGVDYTQFASSKVAYSTVDGKNYGVPFDNGCVVGCYRTDVLQQAGYTIDDFTDITWSQFIEKGKDVLAKTGQPLLSVQAGESDLIMIMLQSAGASLFDAQGNPTIVDNDTLKEVLDVYQQLIKSGVMIQINSWDEVVATLTNAQVAGTINGCWILATIQTAKDQSGKWDITNMPKLEKSSGATNFSNNGGSSWAVSKSSKNAELAEKFLTATFAGSTDLYATILPSSGAIATYTPAAKSDIYNEPQEFFGGDKIFAKIVDYSSKVPSNNTGVYYYEARDAVATALTNVLNGASIDDELKTAQETVKFAMGG